MQYQWSKVKYTLKDLIAQRKDRLPVIIKVVEGYSGSDGDDAHDIATGSVFFVYSIEVQSRIVAQTEDERYLSMSRSCPVNFQVILNDRSLSEPCPLNEIVERERNSLGDLRIQMAGPDDGGLGPMDAGSSDIRGVLRVLDLYDERYLLCHTSLGEGSFRVTDVVSIPSYLPTTIVISTGGKHSSRTNFKEFLNQVNASAINIQREYAQQQRNDEEIVVFSDPPNGNYEFIEATSYVSRIPSLKIVDSTRSPEPEVVEQSTTSAATTVEPERQGDFAATVPRLPPRNIPRKIPSAMEPPRLKEKVKESKLTWSRSNRRPLPPLPDQTGSSVTQEFWSVERRKETVKWSIHPQMKESLSLTGNFNKLTSHSPVLPLKFRKMPSGLEEASSEPETPQRERLTGRTTGQRPEVEKNNSPVTWSSWHVTSLDRRSEKFQKPRPPVPKKPSAHSTLTRKQELTGKSSTGAWKEPDDVTGICVQRPVTTFPDVPGNCVQRPVTSFSDVPGNCVQRPGTLAIAGQLDSSGYEGDYESYYDEIKSPMNRGDRLSRAEQSGVTDEETHQEVSFLRSSDTLSLRSTETGERQSLVKSDSEGDDDPDSSYEEISLPPTPKSSSVTGGTASPDSGMSSVTTNSSTPPTMNNRGVLNFTNTKPDPSSDVNNRRLHLWKSPSQISTLPTLSTTRPWRSVDDVPYDIPSLSVEQVSVCLGFLNLGQYVCTFREQQIDGALLSCLDRDVLVSDFGFRKFDAIKLAKFARDGWRPKVDKAETSCEY